MQADIIRGTAVRAATLVMSMAWGYPLDAYIAFVQSLRDTGYSGDITLVAAGSVDKEVRDFCASRKALILNVPYPTGPIMIQRFGLYRQISGELPLFTGKVARHKRTVHVRDVFFQRDPFEDLLKQSSPPALVLPLEDRLLGPDMFNGYALRKCYGHAMLRKLFNSTVICSGVIVGTPRGFDQLAALMLKERCPFDKMADQAVLNKLVYNGDLPSNITLQFQRRGTGIVNTLGVFKGQPRGLTFKQQHIHDGVVLNDDGTPSACVHQYDRLVKSFGRNATWRRPLNPNEKWSEEELEPLELRSLSQAVRNAQPPYV